MPTTWSPRSRPTHRCRARSSADRFQHRRAGAGGVDLGRRLIRQDVLNGRHGRFLSVATRRARATLRLSRLTCSNDPRERIRTKSDRRSQHRENNPEEVRYPDALPGIRPCGVANPVLAPVGIAPRLESAHAPAPRRRDRRPAQRRQVQPAQRARRQADQHRPGHARRHPRPHLHPAEGQRPLRRADRHRRLRVRRPRPAHGAHQAPDRAGDGQRGARAVPRRHPGRPDQRRRGDRLPAPPQGHQDGPGRQQGRRPQGRRHPRRLRPARARHADRRLGDERPQHRPGPAPPSPATSTCRRRRRRSPSRR